MALSGPLAVAIAGVLSLVPGNPRSLRGQALDFDGESPYTSHPAIVAVSQGGVLTAWTRDKRIPLPFGPDTFVAETLVARQRRANGAAAGPVTVILPEAAEGFVEALLASANEHAALVAWSRRVGSDFLLESRAWRPRGVGERHILMACAGGRLRGLRLLTAGARGYWLIWNEICDGPRIVAMRLDDRGRPTGIVNEVASAGAQPGAAFDAAPRPEGGFVATWVQRAIGAYAPERTLVARAFGSNGQPRDAWFRVEHAGVSSLPGAPPIEPAIRSQGGGRLVVVWPRAADRRLVGRVFREAGERVGPEFAVGEAQDMTDSSPLWAGAADGEAILLWRRSRIAPPGDCVARRIGATGPRGRETPLAARCGEATAAVSSGALLVAWPEPLPEPADYGVPRRARVLSMPLASLR